MRITRVVLAVLLGAAFAVGATVAPASATQRPDSTNVASDVGTQATQFLGLVTYSFSYWETLGYTTALKISTQRDTGTGKLNFRAHFLCHDHLGYPTPCRVTIAQAQFQGRNCPPTNGCTIQVLGQRTNWSLSASNGSVYFIGSQHSDSLVGYRSVADRVRVDYLELAAGVVQSLCFDSGWVDPTYPNSPYNGICQTP